MKLAEALSERADVYRKIVVLRNRLRSNARVQEGEEPSENPSLLLEELDSSVKKFEYLISAINLTNAKTIVDGESLTEKLARRDALKLKIETMRIFLDEASDIVNRASHSEIKIKSTVKVADLQKDVDDLSKELRLLDFRIQESNWTTELIEQ